MDNQSEHGEYVSFPLEQVRKFVTRVWEHPLVDEQTRNHRELAKTRLHDVLNKFGIDPQTYITIPIGSLIWATDEKSDYDYQLVMDSEKNVQKVMNAFSYNEEIIKELKINIVGGCLAMKKFINSPSEFACLLFTPDEYIGGSVEMLKNIRLGAINKMKEGEFNQKDWEYEVGSNFDFFFKYWDDLFLDPDFPYKQKKNDPRRDRSRRIASRLKQRAFQAHDPKKYRETFNKVRESLTIPDFRTYIQAINSSYGALNLLPRSVATGIDHHLQVKQKLSFTNILERLR
ncbi:hypothetical protein HZC27_04015 [Candidatus Roizmanbacteria bacterium]|nr:hypothetical protein [Candidatus Roizmanbacteria bacterium]